MGESEVLWAGTPILLPLPVTLSVPRGARGSDMGGMGLLDPLQAEGTGAGNAAMGWARWEQAPAKVNSATDIPRLHVLTDALVPGAWAKGVLSTPLNPPLPHTCAPARVFPLGLFWEQPGTCSIPFPQGLRLWRGQGWVWHCFGHGASAWSWGHGDAWGPAHPTVGILWSTPIICAGKN